MKALLNGEENILLGSNDVISADYHPGGAGGTPHLMVSRPSRGWSVRLENVRPSHLSLNTSSICGDFLFLHWGEQDLLCVAGYKRFFALDGESGRIAAQEPLEFTDKESLDFLELLVSSERDKLLVVSTKLAWMLEPGIGRIKGIKIPGLAESLAGQENGFSIGYLDTTNVELPKVFMFVQ